jgi:hypothetical protein
MKKVLVSLLCSAAFAAASPVSVSYVNPGSPGIVDSSNDYVGPYTLKIGNQNVAAMCMDDFYVTSGSWSADLTQVNSANLSNTYLGNSSYKVNGTWMTSAQIYDVETYLFSEIIQPKADRVDLQDAAWTFMDEVTGHSKHSYSSAVNNDIQNALANYASFNTSDFEIVSEVSPGNHPEQEFIVATPEPASFGLLGAALVALGFVGIRSRRARAAAAVSVNR